MILGILQDSNGYKDPKEKKARKVHFVEDPAPTDTAEEITRTALAQPYDLSEPLEELTTIVLDPSPDLTELPEEVIAIFSETTPLFQEGQSTENPRERSCWTILWDLLCCKTRDDHKTKEPTQKTKKSVFRT